MKWTEEDELALNRAKREVARLESRKKYAELIKRDKAPSMWTSKGRSKLRSTFNLLKG